MSVRVLAFDTATPSTAVALLPEGTTARHDPRPGERPAHAGRLLALAHHLLGAAGSRFSEVDRVVVGTGPGTFTGLRIGVATARALAQGAGADLVGVSTLRALARAAAGEAAGGAVLAVLDARRGEAFAAGWQGDEMRIAPAAVDPEVLGRLVSGPPGHWLAVGDGAARFRAILEHGGAVVPADGSPLHRVDALALARLGAEAAAGPPDAVVPEYLRLPDAEIARRAR